ncbi:MAG: BamA/TamA family outer membrane protein, partial [Calditrichaeota bacterium]|nr:BamA/TamA family outer membrane protein [Calditrichota bacterium]
IYSTGLFQYVNYELVPKTNDPSQVVLHWKLAEKKMAWLGFRFGVGNEQDDAKGNITTFDFTAEGGHRNIAGTARSISLQVVPSLHYGRETPNSPRKLLNPRNQYSFTFVEPWVLNTRTPGVFKISLTDESPPITNLPATSLETSFNISHVFENYWSYTAGISFQKVDLQENTDISSVNLSELTNLIAG